MAQCLKSWYTDNCCRCRSDFNGCLMNYLSLKLKPTTSIESCSKHEGLHPSRQRYLRWFLHWFLALVPLYLVFVRVVVALREYCVCRGVFSSPLGAILLRSVIIALSRIILVLNGKFCRERLLFFVAAFLVNVA